MHAAVVRTLDDLKASAALRSTDIANIAAVSKATVSRWTTGVAAPHPKTQMLLSDLHYVVMRLEEYYSAAEIRTWLYAPHPQLAGRCAIDVIHEGGAETVLSILDRLDAGAFV